MKRFDYYIARREFSISETRLVQSGLVNKSELRCAQNCQEPSPFLQWLKTERLGGRHGMAA